VKALSLLPIAGIAAFLCLYVAAAMLYPGGTKFNATTSGFSITDNFWCDLLDEPAYNGQTNPSRPYAMAAMITLSGALLAFWNAAPTIFPDRRRTGWICRIAGSLSAVLMIFIFTGYHNQIINVAGGLGIAALAAVLTGLAATGERRLVALAAASLALIGVNFYIWQTEHGLSVLPLIQKVSFLQVFYWIAAVSWRARIRRS